MFEPEDWKKLVDAALEQTRLRSLIWASDQLYDDLLFEADFGEDAQLCIKWRERSFTHHLSLRRGSEEEHDFFESITVPDRKNPYGIPLKELRKAIQSQIEETEWKEMEDGRDQTFQYVVSSLQGNPTTPPHAYDIVHYSEYGPFLLDEQWDDLIHLLENLTQKKKIAWDSAHAGSHKVSIDEEIYILFEFDEYENYGLYIHKGPYRTLYSTKQSEGRILETLATLVGGQESRTKMEFGRIVKENIINGFLDDLQGKSDD
jgi:hypothetical protein